MQPGLLVSCKPVTFLAITRVELSLSHFLLLPVSVCVSVSLAISLFFAVTLAVRLNKAAVGVLCWRAFLAVDPGHWNSLYAQFLSLLSFLQSYSSPNIRLDSFLLLSLYCKIWSFGDLFFFSSPHDLISHCNFFYLFFFLVS